MTYLVEHCLTVFSYIILGGHSFVILVVCKHKVTNCLQPSFLVAMDFSLLLDHSLLTKLAESLLTYQQ